ncbi:hypothetical protein Emag_004333 [Eimeria magna]
MAASADGSSSNSSYDRSSRLARRGEWPPLAQRLDSLGRRLLGFKKREKPDNKVISNDNSTSSHGSGRSSGGRGYSSNSSSCVAGGPAALPRQQAALLQRNLSFLQRQQQLQQQQQQRRQWHRQGPLWGASSGVHSRSVASLSLGGGASVSAREAPPFHSPAETSPAAEGGTAADQAAAAAAAAAGLASHEATAARGGVSVRVSPRPFYFDYQATSPLDPRVVDAMMYYHVDCFGNPHSNSHAAGWEARRAVEEARESSLSSSSWRRTGIAFEETIPQARPPARHTSSLHKSSINACCSVAACCISSGSSREGHEELRERGVLFHTDAAQSFGKLPIDVDAMNVDLLSLSGHKIYGPKGIGALFVRGKRPKVRLKAIIDGGGQERGLRSGTLATPLIVGLGKAASLAVECRESDSRHIKRMFDLLLHQLQQRLPYIVVNGSLESRDSGLSAEGLGFMFAFTGSACTSESLEPSYVLRALGVGEETAHTSLRIGLGRFTREEEVLHCADRLVTEVSRLREMSPLYDAAMEAQQNGGTAPQMSCSLAAVYAAAATAVVVESIIPKQLQVRVSSYGPMLLSSLPAAIGAASVF